MLGVMGEQADDDLTDAQAVFGGSDLDALPEIVGYIAEQIGA